MRLQVIAVGRLKAGPERDLCRRYEERFRPLLRACGLRDLKVVELAESAARRPEDRQADEARAILAQAPASTARIVLDERGASLSSAEFAALLQRTRDEGTHLLSFVVGGPDGLAPEVRSGAMMVLGFGRLTLPHQIVRALLFEQLYRAGTILTGHPYHRS